MKIIKLEAENYKRLKAIQITPEGNTVILSGKNGAGKSSTLDAIWAALSGGEAGKKNKLPIREGEESAIIKLDLGDLLVTRKWTDNEHSYLTVENKEADASFKSPQGILDALVGSLTFDPLAFAGLKGKEQVATLLEVVKLDIDPAEIDAKRKETFEARTEIKRDVIRLEGVLSDKDKPEVDDKAIEINLTETMMELDKAREIKRKKDDIQENMKSLARNASALIVSREELKKDIEDSKKAYAISSKEFEELTVPDIDYLQKKLDGAECNNLLVRRAKEYREISEELDIKRDIVDAHTGKLESFDKIKADAIKKAKMPIDGLSFNEDGLIFNGVPFAQASSAEQLRISVAMAMALNPKLRVIRITDGSLLDSKSMKIIEQMAKDEDFQVWIEVVDETGKIGVYIEDGEIK